MSSIDATIIGGEPLPPADAPAIDGVEIERELGRGGMGAVWLGRQSYLDRRVAVKALTLQGDEVFASRFRREARILAGLAHPHIVACHQAGMAPDGRPFLVMEFVDGPDLKHHLADHGPLEPAEAARLVAETAEGLRHAHAQGIIHRDVKPENILLTKRPDGVFTAKLADLGLARTPRGLSDKGHDLTVAGQVLGTPATMAPEQFGDPDGVDHRADIYGLGCVLYNAMTGSAAFSGRSFAELVASKVHGPAPDPARFRPGLPPALTALCSRMLSRDRDRRPSYDEIIATLRTPLTARRRTPVAWLVGIGLALAAVVVVVVISTGTHQAPKPAALPPPVPLAAPAPTAPVAVAVAPVSPSAAPRQALTQAMELFRPDFAKRLADWNIADPLAWGVSEDVEGFPIAGTAGEIVRPLLAVPGSISGVVVIPTQAKRIAIGLRDQAGRTTSLLLLPLDPIIASMVAQAADGSDVDSQGSATMQDRRVAFTMTITADRLRAMIAGAAVSTPLSIAMPAPPVAVVLLAEGDRPVLFESLRAEP